MQMNFTQPTLAAPKDGCFTVNVTPITRRFSEQRVPEACGVIMDYLASPGAPHISSPALEQFMTYLESIAKHARENQ